MRYIILIPALLLSLACADASAAKAGSKQADGTRLVASQGNQRLLAAAADSPERLTWEAATTWCEQSSAHGHADWRLPDANELALLHRHRKAIDGFQSQEKDDQDPLGYLKVLQGGGEVDRGYWSSTRDGNAAAGLDFTDGSAFQLPVIETPVVSSKWVRCVRTAQ